MKKATDLPIVHMPIAVEFNIPNQFTRADFNIPLNKFTYLFTFDLSSFKTRKNPEAILNAFQIAYPNSSNKNNDIVLVIKLNRIKGNIQQENEYNELIKNTKDDNRIIVIDEMMSREKILGLINQCDCYISLHRSEGFGLEMTEAMYMSKIVIATNYSGNLDFMNNENSCLVDYELIKVKPEEYPNVEEGAEWANPNIHHAAELMLKVYNDIEFRNKIKRKAGKSIRKNHSFKAIGKIYQKRVNYLIKSKTLVNQMNASSNL